MANFLGEIACKLDSKGRLSFPAKFLKQIPSDSPSCFIINRGLEQCLTLYTLAEWEKVTLELQKLNRYDPKQRLFIRQFMRGATEVNVDANNRLLLPKRLLQYANLEKNVILLGMFSRIEIWAEDVFDAFMDIDPAEFADLAQQVMGEEEKDSE